MHCFYSLITTYNVRGITEDLRRVYYIEFSCETKKIVQFLGKFMNNFLENRSLDRISQLS